MSEYVSPSPRNDEFAEVLSEEPEWYTLGTFLGVPVQDLESIVRNHRDATVLRRLIEVHKCLQSRNLCQTWEHIATCLRRMGNHGLADKIHSFYIRPSIVSRPVLHHSLEPRHCLSRSSESSPEVSDKEVVTPQRPILKITDDETHVIAGEFETLRERFDLLVMSVKIAFQNSTVSVEVVRGLIEDKFGEITISATNEKAQLDEMFKWLKQHCSFFQYRVLNYLVDNLLEFNNVTVLQKDISNLKKAVESFKSSALMVQFIDRMKQNVATNSEKLVKLKVREFWSKLTMQQFETVVNSLVDTDELSEIRVGKGCICVNWVIPDHIDSSKLVHEPKPNSDFVKIIGIIYLHIGNNVIYSFEGEGCETIEAAMIQAIELKNTRAIELLLTMGCSPEVATYNEGCAVTNIVNIREKSVDSSSRSGANHVCILGYNEHVEAIVDPSSKACAGCNLKHEMIKQLHQEINMLQQKLLKENTAFHQEEKVEMNKMEPNADIASLQEEQTMVDSLLTDSNPLKGTFLVDLVQKVDSCSDQLSSIISPKLDSQSLVSSHPHSVDSVTEAEKHSQQLIRSLEERLRHQEERFKQQEERFKQRVQFYESRMKELVSENMEYRKKPENQQTAYSTPIPSWCDVMYSNSATPPCTRTLYNYTFYQRTNFTWYSQLFYSSDKGYKLQLRVDANGDGSGKGSHLSLFVYLMRGEYDDELSWPFNGNITVQLLNWSSDNHHEEKTINHYRALLECRERVVGRDRAPSGWGYDFISHTKLLDCSNDSIKFINNDALCFRIISVDILS